MSRPRPRRPVARPARGPEAPGLAARRAALGLIAGVLDRGDMLGDGAAGGAGDGPGAAAARAEARALADLVLRRLGQIDRALAGFVERPPAGAGRHILRLMAAELLFGGTPPHAAVDLGVRLAQGARGTARLSGLINAVGRRLAGAAAALADAADPLDAMPGWLAARLEADWGRAATRAMAEAHLIRPAHDLTPKVPGDGPTLAAETGGTVLPTGSIRLPGRLALADVPGFAAGAWWVQDAAAALPALLLPGAVPVLDLCAAPGGKTLQLAAAGRKVTAVDASAGRLARLHDNLARTRLSAEIVTADLMDWTPPAPAGAILLDAPCSATGTLRRHPDLGHRIDGSGIAALADMQARLIARAYGFLAPGGVLVWCTCSVLKAEGEALAARILADLPGAEPLAITGRDKVPAEFVTAEGWLRTRPDQWEGDGGLDGFFAMRLRRPG